MGKVKTKKEKKLSIGTVTLIIVMLIGLGWTTYQFIQPQLKAVPTKVLVEPQKKAPLTTIKPLTSSKDTAESLLVEREKDINIILSILQKIAGTFATIIPGIILIIQNKNRKAKG